MSLEGVVDLPLHDGHVPLWLIKLMKRVAKAIVEVIVIEEGPSSLIRKLSNPLWFQALNNVIGMDWDSSGSTTVTTGVLKEVLWDAPELGVLIVGGKGTKAKRTPEEIAKASEALNIPYSMEVHLVNCSRLAAKVDSALLQDKYVLYHHSMALSERGEWSIVQQGMNTSLKLARRYHWLNSSSFTIEPHEGVAGYRHKMVLNLVSRESIRVQRVLLDLVNERPLKVLNLYAEASTIAKGVKPLSLYLLESGTGVVAKINDLTYYRPLPRPSALLKSLNLTYEAHPHDVEELLLIKGVGPSTIRALALISELIFEEKPSTKDPVTVPLDPFKYSYTIGGKDGVPYSINKEDAEKVVTTLEDIVNSARLGDRERLLVLKRLRRLKLYFSK
ncbi:MAG: DUF763 domain-containing protein [Sulfolobales archaeon]|nr:DUF763 domain-containing protein [Sulfolobales archaeon]MCX8198787.1 DUF763 domain-containing protein [Sulfolobales archaeon]MDW8169860.1 DUF763 domain-containing protein [Desulfurococcaceae archaeon]